MNNVNKINDSNFDQTIAENNGKLIIKFGATWCGPCKTMSSVLESIAAKRTDINIYDLDIDESPVTAKKYKIKSIPTILFFDSGKLIDSCLGAVSEAKLLNLIGW